MKHKRWNFTVLLFVSVFLTTACSESKNVTEKIGTKAHLLSPEEARKIAKEAYIYGLPMVLNYKTMNMYVVDKKSPEYKGKLNHLACIPRVYTPEDKAIVTPNSDTPYCFVWGDMRAEPLVLTIPEIEKERFYEVQLVDLFTHNYAYVSTVSKGNVPGKYLLTGPDWEGETPEGITEVISAETYVMFALIRTQLFNPSDLKTVEAILNAYNVEPLSTYLGQKAPAVAPALDYPQWIEGEQFTAESFKYIDFMLSLVKTVDEEQALRSRFAKIGLGTDTQFDLSSFSPEVQQALQDGVKEGFAQMEAFLAKEGADPLISSKTLGTRDFLNKSAKENFNSDEFFTMRAITAHMGIYGNSGEEAIYPMYVADTDGTPFDASKHSYTLTFQKGEFPPVSAFWSVTMYDGKTQLLVNNPIDRYLLNSPMMDQFIIAEDGSLTFYIQNESPGKTLEANWLPAPDGPFYAVMRLYGPKKEALDGTWVNPPLIKQ